MEFNRESRITKVDIQYYFSIVFALSKVKEVSQKVRHSLHVNASTEKKERERERERELFTHELSQVE